MFFRNLMLFRIADGWSPTADALMQQLSSVPFNPCGGMDLKSRGWAAPRENGPLVHSVNRQYLISLGVEEKLLPASVVRREAEKRAAAIAKEQDRKVGRKELRDLRDRVTEEFLPKAFVKERRTFVWIDPVNGWLVVDGSQARAEEALEALQKAIGGIALRPLRCAVSPASAMTGWIAEGEPPAGFSIDQDLELRTAAEAQAAIRYVRHSLDGGEIKQHVGAGKMAVRLAMTWNDRISFVLGEKGEIKRLAFLDILREQAEQEAETADEQFDVDFALMAGELGRLLNDLVTALGGEIKEQ